MTKPYKPSPWASQSPVIPEPWQMTQKEWIDGHIKSPGMHREHVRRALIKGETVPTEVLKAYPDLVRQYKVAIPKSPPPQRMQEVVGVDVSHLKELMDSVTVYELESIVSHLSFELEAPREYPIYSRDESKTKNVDYLIRWVARYPKTRATQLLFQNLEAKASEKAAYPVKGAVAGTKYITQKEFQSLKSWPLISRAIDYRHDYRRACHPFTKDGYLSVDAVYNMSAWASWKSSSLDPYEQQIAEAINNLKLYNIMQLNKGRRQDQPALFPLAMLPLS